MVKVFYDDARAVGYRLVAHDLDVVRRERILKSAGYHAPTRGAATD